MQDKMDLPVAQKRKISGIQIVCHENAACPPGGSESGEDSAIASTDRIDSIDPRIVGKC